jgi:ABC-2 type transport system ATP-binding protein
VIVTLEGVRIGTGTAAELPEMSLTFGGVTPTLAVAETGRRPIVLSLVAGGRMRIDAGRVLVDGEPASKRLRAAVALVDTPVVGEPSDDVSVRAVVREELGLARRPADRGSVNRVLDAHGLLSLAGSPFRTVPPTARIRLLADLAASRPGVEALVLTSPERHGGAPGDWYAVVRALTARGVGVLVVTTSAIAEHLAADNSAENSIGNGAENGAGNGGPVAGTGIPAAAPAEAAPADDLVPRP